MASPTSKEQCNVENLEFDGTTVLCRVCGDKASGFHYGVHACEGCKGFFRRSIQQKLQYRPCLKNQQCNIMRVNRNRCQYCRLRKCIAVGMSRDAVRFGRVPKREKAKIMEQMHRVNAQSQSSSLSTVLDNESEVIRQIVEAHHRLCDFTSIKHRMLTERAWHKPDIVDCPPHKACPLKPAPSQITSQWEYGDLFTPAIRNVVNFAKCIPGFQVFCQEDQVTLLKAGTFEVLLLHMAPLFDSRSNTMLFANGQIYKRTSAVPVNQAGYLLDSMFDFAERFNELGLTDAEVALFSALVLAAEDRPGLRFPDQVSRVKVTIAQGLEALIQANHPDDSSLFSRLLLKKPDLRTLNILHSEKLLGMTLPHEDADSPQLHCSLSPSAQDDVKDIKPERLASLHSIQQSEAKTCPVSMATASVGQCSSFNKRASHFDQSVRSPAMMEPDVPGNQQALKGSYSNGIQLSSTVTATKRHLETPLESLDKNPKVARLWEYDMRSSRSGSLSSNSSHDSTDSAYRTMSSPGTPHTSTRSPLLSNEDAKIHAPVLKEALKAPVLISSAASSTKCPYSTSNHSDARSSMVTMATEKLSPSGAVENRRERSPVGETAAVSNDTVTSAGQSMDSRLLALQYQAMLHPAMLFNHYAALQQQLLQSQLPVLSKHLAPSSLPPHPLQLLQPPALKPLSIVDDKLPETESPLSPAKLYPIKVEPL